MNINLAQQIIEVRDEIQHPKWPEIVKAAEAVMDQGETEVIVMVYGGLVVGVKSSSPGVEVEICDLDNLDGCADAEEVHQIKELEARYECLPHSII